MVAAHACFGAGWFCGLSSLPSFVPMIIFSFCPFLVAVISLTGVWWGVASKGPTPISICAWFACRLSRPLCPRRGTPRSGPPP